LAKVNDDKQRCSWSQGSQLYRDYHDNEWGVPLHDDNKLFEFLALGGFQAGLTWELILTRREAFREAFDNFEGFLNHSLEQALNETQAKILIIDNITYLKNETEKAKDALPLMKHLKSLKSKFRLSILALAHTPKRDLSKQITRNDLQGSKMLIKNGRFGKFLACSKYPHCKVTKPFLDKIGVSCPQEGCSGEIIRKKTKKGRTFYGCSNYPKCSFVTWNKPVDKKCPRCNHILVIMKGKKNGFYYKCSNSACNYKDVIKEGKNSQQIAANR